jgi:RluA family pseudouridine synthase
VLDVRFIDNHLLVVNKPPGVPVQGDVSGDPDLLGEARDYLKERFSKPGRVFLGLVHRLDRPTSGLLVFARTSKSAARLSEAFRRREVEKRYLAIVEGNPDETGSFTDWLVRSGRHVRLANPQSKDARMASLSYRKLGTSGEAALVEVELKTGRKHQIRVQFAERGHPLVGDLRYGAKILFDGRNLALHCRMLGLVHPVRKVAMRWVCDPPDTWRSWFDEAYQSELE